MNRKLIKKYAKRNLKKNYLQCVVVSFFVAILIGTVNFTPVSEKAINYLQPSLNFSLNYNVTTEFIKEITHIDLQMDSYKPTRGYLAALFNSVTASKSFVFGFLNSLNQFLFHNRLLEGTIILIGALISFILWLFVRNVFVVGEKRFFLENIYHPKTTFNRTLLPYKVKRTRNVSLGILRKSLFELFYAFTIFGWFIKHYAYAMIPFILAENPKIKPKEAMDLSSKMMEGKKFELFKFDLSLLGWTILDLFTLHLLYFFFLNSYKQCCLANFYLDLKKEAQKKKILNYELLNDDYLTIPSPKYPQEKFSLKEASSRKWLTTNYRQKYSLTSLILLFFSASIIGFLWESGFHLFQYGSLVKRGTMHGPWLPIYGWGLVILLILLRKYRDRPFLTFILSMIICGIIEYFTGWYLETFNHARWWDYDGYFLNLHGRICLEGLLAFGIGGVAFIYFIAPLLDNLYRKMQPRLKQVICLILCLSYVVDFIYSSIKPNTGLGINTNITEKNPE